MTGLTCQGCDHELTVDDRFCRRCGLPVPAGHAGSIGTVHGQATSRGFGGHRTLLVVAVILGAALTATVWQPATVMLAGLTAVIDVDPVDPTEPIQRTAGEEPILDGVEGRLLLSNHGHMTILDLGSGDAEVFETEGLVVDIVDRELLMVQTGFGNPRVERSIRLVPIDDPGGRGRVLTEVDHAVTGSYYDQAIEAVYDDAIVVSSDYVVSPFDGYEPAIGRPVVVRFEDGATFDVARYPTAEPTYYPGAGTFVHTDGGFVKVADGAPVSVGDTVALMEECEAPDDCEWYWVDYRSRSPLDRRLPEPIDDLTLAAMTHIGRDSMVVLQYLPSTDGREQKQYFDTGRGRVVDVEELRVGVTGRVDSTLANLIGPRIAGEDVFGNGRFLAYPRFGGVGILDLETNTEVAVVSESMPGSPVTVRYLPASSRR